MTVMLVDYGAKFFDLGNTIYWLFYDFTIRGVLESNYLIKFITV